MERLTFDGNFCEIAQCRELPCEHGGSCSQRKVWERLKEYESTGLTPEEIARAKLETEAGCLKAIARTYGIDPNRLREIAKADRNGRVVVLPVKPVLGPVVSSMLYIIEDGEIFEDWLYEVVVGMSESGHTNAIFLTGQDQISFSQSDIGKAVFLTCEDAEAALKEVSTDG